MVVATKYKVFLDSSFLDQNLQPIFNSDLAGVWESETDLEAAILASGSANTNYEIITYKYIVE